MSQDEARTPENTATQTQALPKDNGPGGGGGNSCIDQYQACYARCGEVFGSDGFGAVFCEAECDGSYRRCTTGGGVYGGGGGVYAP